MIKALQGDSVKVRYVGRLSDGTVFDASPEDWPLQFILGQGEVVPGFDEGVTGMYAGERRTFTFAPEKGYGEHDPRFVEEIDLAQLPDGLELHVGRQLEITSERGDRLLVLVSAVGERSVTLDGNHPLAGQALTFEVELLEVKKIPPPPTRSPS